MRRVNEDPRNRVVCYGNSVFIATKGEKHFMVHELYETLLEDCVQRAYQEHIQRHKEMPQQWERM